MAKAPINTWIGREIRGTSDDVVFRKVGGEFVIARRPRPTDNSPSEETLRRRKRFKQGAEFAKGVLCDSVRKEEYLAALAAHNIPSGQLFAMALRDWMKPPVIGLIDTSHYQRHAGDRIRITATDDLEVTSVKLKLTRQSDGAPIEEGAATYVAPYFDYVAKTEAPAGLPLVVTVTATDHAGNESTATLGISE